MSVVKDFLRMAGIDLTSPPAPPDPRDELKRLRQATIEARKRHEEELAVVSRLETLIPTAAAAEREAVDAEAAYQASILSWARGASDSPAVGDGELARQAEGARARATRARLAAKGAEGALVAKNWDASNSNFTALRSTSAEVDAREMLRAAESAEQFGRGPILDAQIEPALSEFCELMNRVRELDERLQAFEAFARYGANTGRFKGFLSRYAAARQFAAPPRTAEERTNVRMPWTRFDNALKRDPDAQFDV